MHPWLVLCYSETKNKYFYLKESSCQVQILLILKLAGSASFLVFIVAFLF